MSLSNYERETIFLYNQAEENCVLTTHNPALIRKMDKFIENGEAITVLASDDGYREYSFTKKAVKVRFPRKLSDEKRAELVARMKAIKGL